MGVKLLHTFLRSISHSSRGIREITLDFLRNKKIAIDVSIYLYRYQSQSMLIENIFKMCSIFREYNIQAIFVFDGEEKVERKRDTCMKRKMEKKEALAEYNNYSKQLRIANSREKKAIEEKMKQLKKKIVYITHKDISQVKTLLKAYGITYMVAVGEADVLCAALAKANLVYACMSEDTDMFVYGVPRVIKYFSLMKHTGVLYETQKILDDLHIDMDNFRHLCVVSGTDYNTSVGSIYKFYKLFCIYAKIHKDANSDNTFLKWLAGKYISMQNYYKLLDINIIYNIDTSKILQEYAYIIIKNKEINFISLKDILSKNNFIFS